MITVKIEKITPAKAEALIASCPRNRKISTSRVESYSDIMKRKCWGPCSMIVIDEDGNLVDGGHRLKGVIASGCTVEMVVMRGLDKKYVPFIDTGRPRSAGDMLAFIEGSEDVGNLRSISTIARNVLRYDMKSLTAIIPFDTLADFVMDNKDSMTESMSDYRKMRPIGGTLSTASALYLIRRSNPLDRSRVEEFVNQVSLGENIYSGMPSYATRNAMFSLSRIGKAGGRRQVVDMYVLMKGWSHFKRGEQLKQIKTTAATNDLVLTMKI